MSWYCAAAINTCSTCDFFVGYAQKRPTFITVDLDQYTLKFMCTTIPHIFSTDIFRVFREMQRDLIHCVCDGTDWSTNATDEKQLLANFVREMSAKLTIATITICFGRAPGVKDGTSRLQSGTSSTVFWEVVFIMKTLLTMWTSPSLTSFRFRSIAELIEVLLVVRASDLQNVCAENHVMFGNSQLCFSCRDVC